MSTTYTKRKRSDNADAGDHGRRYKQHKQFSNRPRSNNNPGSRHAHARPGHARSGDGEEEEAQKSINALKGRIRDLRRSLAHVDNDPKNRMPQGIRIERQRELESARHELEEKETAKREAKFRNDIIGKYHMVRFFGESFHITMAVHVANHDQNGKRPRGL
jgi:regulator of replication initiation timing